MFLKKIKQPQAINYVALPGLLNDYKLKFNKTCKNDSLEFLMHHVLKETGVSENAFTSRSRQREYVEARHIFCYLSRKFTSSSLKEVALKMGGRDHTTAIHSLHTAKNLLETHEPFGNKVAAIETSLIGFKDRILKYEVIADIRA